jgi:hypothetical protein
LNAKEDLLYQEDPVKVLEMSERVTRNRMIMMCEVQWSHYTKEEAIWEREEDLKVVFPSFLSDPFES